MTILSTREHRSSPIDTAPAGGLLRPARLAVDWTTVLTLAIVLAFADGYWLTSLRGAVGAVGSNQSLFATWWREATVVLPFFVLAVLGALTLAMRWFGAAFGRPKAVLSTIGLVALAGAGVGIAEVVVDSAYNYRVETAQLRAMAAMDGNCVGRCIAQLEHDTLAVQIRGLFYVGRWMLLTNLVLVAFVVALRGGRIRVGRATRPSARTIGRQQGGIPAGPDDRRRFLVAMVVSAGAIHAAVVPEHFAEWTAAGIFFVLLALSELAVAVALLRRVNLRASLLATVVVSVGPIGIWLYSRSVGLPFGPDPGTTEPLGIADCAASILELGAVLLAVFLLRSRNRSSRPAGSAHRAALVLVAVAAVATVGVAATGITTLTVVGTAGGHSSMVMSH
jgi:hypothetical protein